MGDAVYAGKKFTGMLIVGETHRMREKVHHGIIKMEVTVSKPGLARIREIEVLLCQTVTEDIKGESEEYHGV